jgi:hypothetical protein
MFKLVANSESPYLRYITSLDLDTIFSYFHGDKEMKELIVNFLNKAIYLERFLCQCFDIDFEFVSPRLKVLKIKKLPNRINERFPNLEELSICDFDEENLNLPMNNLRFLQIHERGSSEPKKLNLDFFPKLDELDVCGGRLELTGTSYITRLSYRSYAKCNNLVLNNLLSFSYNSQYFNKEDLQNLKELCIEPESDELWEIKSLEHLTLFDGQHSDEPIDLKKLYPNLKSFCSMDHIFDVIFPDHLESITLLNYMGDDKIPKADRYSIYEFSYKEEVDYSNYDEIVFMRYGGPDELTKLKKGALVFIYDCKFKVKVPDDCFVFHLEGYPEYRDDNYEFYHHGCEYLGSGNSFTYNSFPSISYDMGHNEPQKNIFGNMPIYDRCINRSYRGNDYTFINCRIDLENYPEYSTGKFINCHFEQGIEFSTVEEGTRHLRNRVNPLC